MMINLLFRNKARKISQTERRIKRPVTPFVSTRKSPGMRLPASLMMIVVAFSLSANTCQNGPNKELVGTLAGAAIGGYVGSTIGKGQGQAAAIAVGTLAGAMIGGSIGGTLDEVDRMKMNQAVQQAQVAPLGQSIAWNNAQSGHSGTVTALRDGWSDSRQYCRQFEQVVQVDGRNETAAVTACRDDDGNWVVLP